MQPTLATFIALILAISGVVFFLIGLRSSSADELTKRVVQYISDAEQPDITTATPVQRTELSGSFRERVLSPAIAKTADLIGRLTPGELSTTLKYQLALAGNPMGLTPRGFYLFRIIFTLLGVVLCLLVAKGVIGFRKCTQQRKFYFRSGTNQPWKICLEWNCAAGLGQSPENLASPEGACTQDGYRKSIA